MVEGIVKQLLPSMKPILIQTSTEIEKFRKELFSSLNEKEQKRIIIYYGSRTSKEDVKCLCYDRAEEIYIIGEDTRTDDMESFHDTMNMECLRLINEEIRTFHSIEKKERIVCL